MRRTQQRSALIRTRKGMKHEPRVRMRRTQQRSALIRTRKGMKPEPYNAEYYAG